MRNRRIALRRSVGARPFRRVDVQRDEIERAADRRHVARLHLGRIRPFLRQIFVDVAALHDRGKEHRVHFPRRLLRGRNVLRRFDHRHIEGRVVGDADLRAGLRVSPDRLNAEAVGEHAMVADLVHLRGWELQPRCVNALQVTEVGEAAQLVDGDEMVHAVGKMSGHEAGIVGVRARGIAVLPAARKGRRQVPVEHRDIRLDPVGQQIVDHAVVMIDALLVRLPASFGENPRPGERHAIRRHAEVLQQLGVLRVPVVTIGRDVAVVVAEHLAGRMGEDVPVGRSAPVLLHRPLDLVGGGCAAPAEAGGELELIGGELRGGGCRTSEHSRRGERAQAFAQLTPIELRHYANSPLDPKMLSTR